MGQRGKIEVNQALWFLPTLFIIEMIFFLLMRINKYVLLLFATVVAYFAYPSIGEPRLWFGFDGALYYFLFYVLGYVLIGYINIYLENKWFKLVGLFCMLIIIFFTIQPTFYSQIFSSVISAGQLVEYSCFVVMAIVGIWGCVFLAYRLEKSQLLVLWGRNSLIILGFHLFFLESAYYLSASLGMNVNQNSNVYSLVISIAVLYILKPIINICNLYFPDFLGKTKKI